MFLNLAQMSLVTGGSAAAQTLAAVTGFPTFAQILTSIATTRNILYTIREYTDASLTVPLKWEHGFGSYNQSTNVLTRIKVLSTWDGTSYVTVSPSMLSFGTANTRVFSGPCADAPHHAVMPFQNYTVGDAMGATGLNMVMTASTFQMVSNTEYYMPFLHGGTGRIIAVNLYVTSRVTGTACKVGFYDIGSDGLPGRLVWDATGGTPVDTGTAAGIFGVTVSKFLPPGWYYLCLLANGIPTLRAFQAAGLWPGPGGSSSGNPNTRLSGSGSYATGLPSTRTATLTAGSNLASPTAFLKSANT